MPELNAATIAAPPNIALPKTRVTFEEYLALYEGVHAEWLDGEVKIMSPASDRHQDLSDFLLTLLRFLVESNKSGIVRSAPLAMKIPSRPSGREPDILFVAHENLARLKPTHLEGAADVVIEIISPESQARDRGEKFYEYEAAGVREYWMLDFISRRAEFYRLNEQGRFELISTEDGMFRSAVINGFEIKVEWLWQEPLPTIIEVLREWKII